MKRSLKSAATLPIPEDPKLKSPGEFRIIGKSQRRIDTPAKVNGSAVYGIDVAIDGMKTAAVVISPVDGGKVKSVDETDARKIPGVIDVLHIDDAVAVVGEHYWAARAGVEALNVDWDLGPNAKLTTASIRAEVAKAADEGTPLKALERGDVEARLKSAAKRLTAEYELPFLAHATMEPINTTVHVRPDGCDIWVGTQTPVVAQKHAARITGLPVDKVTLHNHLIGGGFGRRLQADTIEQAVRFAKQVPYPLKIIWTREQDIRHDRFRPCYLDKLAAGLDEQGRPSVWTHRTTSGTVRRYFDEDGWPEGKLDKDAVDGAWDSPYAFPAIRVDWIRHDPPVKLNWWRGVGPTHNVFVVESFLDELAHTAGQDPIAYRRALLDANPRAMAVLDKVADAAGWNRPLEPRSGRGVSLHQNFGTYAALVVEVAVALSGEISLKKIVAAVDCGIQINPDTIRAQIEGGVLFGLSAALFNGITFDEGRVQQGNFNDYRQLRINETPPIEVHLLDSGERSRRPRRSGNGVCGPRARECDLRSDRCPRPPPADRSEAAFQAGKLMNRRRTLITVGALGVVGAIAAACFFFWPASIEAVQATDAQPTGSALVAKGEYLTKAADCAACHTAPGGKPFAGGRAFKLPFGTIYSTNITPDQETGIGRWSDAEFVRALHRGIGRNGEDLYPAFPYTAYALLSTDDVLAIRAYLSTLRPVTSRNADNTLVFPFNQRYTLRAWKLLFMPTRQWEPSSGPRRGMESRIVSRRSACALRRLSHAPQSDVRDEE